MALDGFLVSEFTVSLYNESQLSFHFDSGVKYNQQCLTVSYRKKNRFKLCEWHTEGNQKYGA